MRSQLLLLGLLTVGAILARHPAAAAKQAVVDDAEFNDDFAEDPEVAADDADNDDFAEDLEVAAAEPETVEESAAEEPAGATDAKPGKKNRRKSKPARKNKPAAAETPSIAVPGPETVKQPRRVTVFTQMADSALEIVGITVVVLAALVALVGRSRNSSAAGRWHDECKELLVENFAEVGIPSQNLTLIPESAYEFVLYGTGRKSCRSMTAKMTYPKRHDLWDTMSTLLAAPEPEVLSITFDLKQENMQGFVFAVTPTRLAKKFKQEYEDLSKMAQTFNGSAWGLPNELSIITDSVTVVPAILTDQVVKFLTAYKTRVRLFHYSDFFMGKREPNAMDAFNESYKDPTNTKGILSMQFSFSPMDAADTTTYAGAMQGAIALNDHISRIELATSAKKECLKKRQAFVDNYSKEDPEAVKQRVEDQKLARAKAEKDRHDAMDENNPTRIAYEKQQAKKKAAKDKKRTMKRGMVSMRS